MTTPIRCKDACCQCCSECRMILLGTITTTTTHVTLGGAKMFVRCCVIVVVIHVDIIILLLILIIVVVDMTGCGCGGCGAILPILTDEMFP
jgi:hypothetical protein